MIAEIKNFSPQGTHTISMTYKKRAVIETCLVISSFRDKTKMGITTIFDEYSICSYWKSGSSIKTALYPFQTSCFCLLSILMVCDTQRMASNSY